MTSAPFWGRRFISGYADIAKPLHKLTEKNQTFDWTPQCQAAFDKLKQKLISAPVLAYPDPLSHFCWIAIVVDLRWARYSPRPMTVRSIRLPTIAVHCHVQNAITVLPGANFSLSWKVLNTFIRIYMVLSLKYGQTMVLSPGCCALMWPRVSYVAGFRFSPLITSL